MADAAERTADAVEALATAFGYIPKAAELAADGATRALNRIPKNVAIDVNYRTPDVIMGPNGEEIPIGGGSGREGVWNPTGEVIGGPGGDQVVVGSPRRDAPFVAPVAAPSSAPIVVNTSVVGTVDGRVLLRFVSTELPRYVETITGQRVTA
jgi:hypothetical protein